MRIGRIVKYRWFSFCVGVGGRHGAITNRNINIDGKSCACGLSRVLSWRPTSHPQGLNVQIFKSDPPRIHRVHRGPTVLFRL